MGTQGFDVVVIGAGHAGCEAALAAARLGASTLLLTINLDTIAWLPCSSSIGGPGRGQLVREVDALGGEMARHADRYTIHARRANTAKGPAVQAPFALVDKRRYSLGMKYLIEATENLAVRQALIVDITPTGDHLVVRSAFEEEFIGRAVVITAGTFLGGEVAYGAVRERAGRYSEVAATELSQSLRSLGFSLGRFKTGTSPRVAARSVDLSRLEQMLPDAHAEPFSFGNTGFDPASLPCYKTRTSEETAHIIRAHAHESPLPPEGSCTTGARYCPSIEDKVLRHPEREHHPLFLQPEALDAEELSVHGLSTSLSPEVQYALVRSVPGLESAQIMRPGYAVVYDFLYPDQLTPTLETKRIEGLYTAGQINGTSGYEEAAAQGLVAGINAALKVQGKDPFILDRSQAYIGVLIDDLVTKGVDEPYRMFTSRAEYRLILRSDNADVRLTPIGYALGLIDEGRMSAVREKERLIGEAVRARRAGRRQPDVLPPHIAREVEAELVYEGYIIQELKKIEAHNRLEALTLPPDIDYDTVRGLCAEAREKLARIRPVSVGQAGRIPGLRQSDLQALSIVAAASHVKPE